MFKFNRNKKEEKRAKIERTFKHINLMLSSMHARLGWSIIAYDAPCSLDKEKVRQMMKDIEFDMKTLEKYEEMMKDLIED